MPAIVRFKVDADNGIAVLANGTYAGALEAAAEEISDAIAEELVSFPFAGQTSPRDDRGPRFAESIEVFDAEGVSGFGIVVGSNSPHAAVLETGSSGDYLIHPQNEKGKLVFDNREGYVSYREPNPKSGKTKKLAKLVAVREVRHPGIQNPPRPFETTITKVEPRVFTIIEKVIAQAYVAAQLAGRRGRLPGTIREESFANIPGATRTRVFRGSRGRFVG